MYGKLGFWAKQHVFIIYSEASKGYMMLGEHPDRGMIEVVSKDMEFIEYEFSSIGEIRKDLELYELQEDSPTILSEGGELEPSQGVVVDSGSDLPSGSAPMSGSAPAEPSGSATVRDGAPLDSSP